jgi:triosephosphate isomerase
MPNRRPLIAGNWKMNGLRADGLALARALAGRMQAGQAFDMLVCPPATLLTEVGGALEGSAIWLGGQDCHPAEKGAHTGDLSPVMLADIGCSHVIVGHSERRTDHGEGDETVSAKAAAALAAGLIAIVCVGETAEQRDAGETLSVVSSQISGSLPDGVTPDNTVIAYEPVWAIGTGRTPTPEEAQEVHAMMRGDLAKHFDQATADRFRLLYGGSVKPDNADILMALPDIDGALVGGASLDAEQFWAIAQSCS